MRFQTKIICTKASKFYNTDQFQTTQKVLTKKYDNLVDELHVKSFLHVSCTFRRITRTTKF